MFGGVTRMRVSSQSLKRAWRTSAVFAEKLDNHLASRTQRLGQDLRKHLEDGGMAPEAASRTARSIAGLFGKLKRENDDKPEFIEQLAFVSPEERATAFGLADRALAGETIEPKAADVLLNRDSAADIAMFGRMLADNPGFNREAAAQVAHAITTHKAVAEDDFYTAVDDLKDSDEGDDAGAGFVGVQEFGSGVFYQYLCVNRDLLTENLGGNRPVRDAAIAALVEAAATVAPRGKQASFASRAYALYAVAEKGPQQPRSLAAAFLRPVDGHDLGESSRNRLIELRQQLERAYGACADAAYEMDVVGAKGSLAGLIDFAVS